jgi:hypothetical protein
MALEAPRRLRVAFIAPTALVSGETVELVILATTDQVLGDELSYPILVFSLWKHYRPQGSDTFFD